MHDARAGQGRLSHMPGSLWRLWGERQAVGFPAGSSGIFSTDKHLARAADSRADSPASPRAVNGHRGGVVWRSDEALLRMPTSHCRGSQPLLHFQPNFLLMSTRGGTRRWLQHLGPGCLCVSSTWGLGVLALAWHLGREAMRVVSLSLLLTSTQ